MDEGSRLLVGISCAALAWSVGGSWLQIVLVYVVVMLLSFEIPKESK